MNEFIKSEFYKKLKLAALKLMNFYVIEKIENLYEQMNKKESTRKEKSNLLFDYIKRQKYNYIKNILDNYNDIINIKNNLFKTPLMRPSQYCDNNLKIFNLLLKYNPNKNIVDNTKSSALHIACQFNNYKCISKLITKENISLKNTEGDTALMVAIKNKNYNCIEYLQSGQYKSDFNLSNNNDETPLVYLLKNGIKNKMVYKLLINNISYIKWGQFKNLLLNNIINNESFIETIIKNGFYILRKKKNKFIQAPLIFSIKNNFIDLSKVIINLYNGIIDEKDENQKSFIIYALENKNITHFKLILESKKININEINNEKAISLIYSNILNDQNKDIIELLLFQYIDAHETKKDENEKLKKTINQHYELIYNELIINKNNFNYNTKKKIIQKHDIKNQNNKKKSQKIKNKSNNKNNNNNNNNCNNESDSDDYDMIISKNNIYDDNDDDDDDDDYNSNYNYKNNYKFNYDLSYKNYKINKLIKEKPKPIKKEIVEKYDIYNYFKTGKNIYKEKYGNSNNSLIFFKNNMYIHDNEFDNSILLYNNSSNEKEENEKKRENFNIFEDNSNKEVNENESIIINENESININENEYTNTDDNEIIDLNLTNDK